MENDRSSTPLQAGTLLALGQGLFYLGTGIWPLISIRTFQKVTGPKFDIWLVKMVGVLVTVIGGVLLFSAFRRPVSPEAKLLAVGSAAGFTGIDTVYVARKRISPIYLADAAAELCLILLWSIVSKKEIGTLSHDE